MEVNYNIQSSIFSLNLFWPYSYLYNAHTGFVNRLLSWKGFLPLGRLTYCVYLIHFDFLIAFYAAMRKRFYYNLFDQFIVCFGILVMSFTLAFVTSVTLEASFLNLEKLMFSSKPKSKFIINKWGWMSKFHFGCLIIGNKPNGEVTIDTPTEQKIKC
jgi:peptidoglycan/LPS O-acetylase OafA/YrhL